MRRVSTFRFATSGLGLMRSLGIHTRRKSPAEVAWFACRVGVSSSVPICVSLDLMPTALGGNGGGGGQTAVRTPLHTGKRASTDHDAQLEANQIMDSAVY